MRVSPTVIVLPLLLAVAGFGASARTLTVDVAAPGRPISGELFGIFFEDLNYAADGGLYAELIQNRSFEYSATEQPSWGPFSFWDLVKTNGGDGQLGLGDARPLHIHNPHYLLLTVLQPGEGVGVANRGFDGIPVEAGKAYAASFWAYQTFNGKKWSPGFDQTRPMRVTVQLQAKDGAVLASAPLEVAGRAWRQYAVELRPERTDPEARFVLLAHDAGGLALDMVSLFPRDTFRGRPNGLRRDLAETIADLKPKFMRFPGGCLVHGPGVRHYYDWKASIGPVEQRRAQRNSWGYHQTLGLGYFEYFQFCEDIGAVPLPVVSAGVCCQHAGDSPGRGQEGLPMEEMPAYVQDILDLIEWANGPDTSTWGAKRAAAGHPAPFGLKYLGVGNEDAITPEFKERFQMIQSVLKEKHPEIVVIGTAGPFPDGEDFEKGWAFARELRVPMVDEHYYRPPAWFWENLHRYDRYDRKSAKVYVGEYAAHDPDRRNTLRTALAEAAGGIGFENNGDVVHFASYAPLLARRGHTQWTPDLIYFTGTRVYPSINFEVQRLLARHRGDLLLSAGLSGVAAGERLAVSAVRDSASGDTIIKVVNGDDEPRPVHLRLSGLPATARSGTAIVLTAASADVANVDAEPSPATTTQTDLAPALEFDHTFAAHSLTVLRFR